MGDRPRVDELTDDQRGKAQKHAAADGGAPLETKSITRRNVVQAGAGLAAGGRHHAGMGASSSAADRAVGRQRQSP